MLAMPTVPATASKPIPVLLPVTVRAGRWESLYLPTVSQECTEGHRDVPCPDEAFAGAAN